MTKGSAIRTECCREVWITDSYTNTGIETNAAGLDLYRTSDSWIATARFSGYGYAMRMHASHSNTFNQIYFAGSTTEDNVYISDSDSNSFTLCVNDHSKKHGWHIGGWYGCDDNTWTACKTSNTGSQLGANNTYSGWYFTGNVEGGNSTDNVIIGSSVIHRGPIMNQWKFGIEEAAGLTDHNTYIGNNLRDPASGGVYLSKGSKSINQHNQG